jgi:molecular chaperone DnaK
LLEQTLMLVERMIADAQFTPGQIDQLLLVGGSTRMPMCSKRLQAFWGRLPGSVLNPDECVATGAALQAALLAGTTFSKSTGLLKNKPEVRDVTAHSLGYIMASADNSRFVNSIILKRNSPIPVENAQRRLLPTRPNDTNELDVYLLQGESTRPLDNSLLGKYTFGEVPHYKGETEVRIEYRYNSDGMVEVRAFDQHSGKALKGPQITRDGLDISWSDQSPKEIQQSGRCVIYLAFDLSGSMEGKPLQEAKRAAHAFVGQCNLQNTLVGLIAFSDTSNVDLVATNDAKAIATAIERLSSGKTGYGNDTDPFEAIQRQLEQEEGLRYAIVLADGVWEDQSRAVQRAKRCHALGIQVVAVGFGGADKRFLQQISSSSTQSFFTDLNSLTSTFSSIARDIATAGLSR